MIQLRFQAKSDGALCVLCLGAHSDDIEIGCGGTVLRLAREYPGVVFHWVVFSAVGVRESEARHGVNLFAGAAVRGPILKSFPDGFMPYVGGDMKAAFEDLKQSVSPDLILCPWRKDAHQDHRFISELAWNTFRDHMILEYEIPKYDGDMGQPNVFLPLEADLAKRKVQHLMESFPSQQTKRWFEENTFLSLMRLRGIECNAESGYAEAFHCRKMVL